MFFHAPDGDPSNGELEENVSALMSTVAAVQRKASERLDAVENHPRVKALLHHCAALEKELQGLRESSGQMVEDQVRERLRTIADSNAQMEHESFMTMQNAVSAELSLREESSRLRESQAELVRNHSAELSNLQMKLKRAARREASLMKQMKLKSEEELKALSRRAQSAVSTAHSKVSTALFGVTTTTTTTTTTGDDGTDGTAGGNEPGALVMALESAEACMSEISELEGLAKGVFVHTEFTALLDARKDLLVKLEAAGKSANAAHDALSECSERLCSWFKEGDGVS